MKWKLIGLPSLILGLALVMVATDFILYGAHPANVQRGLQNIVARPNQGPALRFLLQPAMSMILGIRDGIRDARTGRSPYLWTILFDPTRRWANIREGIAVIGKVFLVAVAVDVVYQIIELLSRRQVGQPSAGRDIDYDWDFRHHVSPYWRLLVKAFYPNEALLVATLLAFVPYLILRGPVARIARLWQRKKAMDLHA